MVPRQQNPRSRQNFYNRYRSDSPYYDRQQGRDQDWNGNRFRDGRNGQSGRYASQGGVARQRRGYRDNPNYQDFENFRGANPQTPRNGRERVPQKRNNHTPFEPGDPATYIDVSGVLETHPNGYGFLRNPNENYSRLPADSYVPAQLINKLNLREGVMIEGKAQPSPSEAGPRPGSRLMEIKTIDGLTPEEYADIKPFDEMVPINPEFWIKLSTGAEPISTRVMDLLTPLGKGQRALIVAPPRSGKTVLLQQISQAVITNYPDIHVIVLLIDERPEEVTDFRRAVSGAEVVASSLDCNLESHVRIAQFISERCKRLAEEGKDVFLLLDSITRLARAFNKWVGNTGRTMSGGIDIKAMDIPKKIFSSARMNEGGGSLTIVGTALVDTGSRMDELIFQEFKGTGNMELVLDRRLADRRVWPAIDISKSGTRREEKLLPPETLHAVNMIRRVLIPMNPVEAMEKLVKELSRYESNEEFFKRFVRHE